MSNQAGKTQDTQVNEHKDEKVNEKVMQDKPSAPSTPINSKQSQQKVSTPKTKPIALIQKRLKASWIVWIGYRLLLLPTLLGVLHPKHPDIISGIFWYFLWLIPALLLSPWMLKGKSAYMLLVGSMFTLVYFGASGVTVFSRFYDNGLSVIWIYVIDLILITLVNYFLFVLLKRLPSMNGVDKNKP